MSDLSNILKENKKIYSHLLFGEDRPEIRKHYKIPKNENILVVAPLDQKNVLSSTVITDRCIYTYNNYEEPIMLTMLCDFVFMQEAPGCPIIGISKKRDVTVFPKQSGNSSTGRELLHLLGVFQTNLMSVASQLKRQYEIAIANALTLVRKSFHETGILGRKSESLLAIIEDTKFYEAETYYVRAENCYRRCDCVAYNKYINTLEEKRVRSELIHQLRHPEELFFESFVRDISNPYALYITQNLVGSYSALRNKNLLSNQEAIILSYLCIRMEDNLYLHKILNDYSRRVGEKCVWEIMCFSAKYKNERMSNVYNRIISEEEVKLPELAWVDSLYLTPLHYALILRNTKAVDTILEMRDWSDYDFSHIQNEENRILYDFNFVASILYENPHFLRRIFLKTSKMAKPIQKAIKQLEQKIYINEKLGNESAVLEYKLAKADMERELSDLIATTLQKNRLKAVHIFESGNDFAKYLMRVYENSDSLFHILTGTISEWRLYRDEQHFFITNIEQEFNYSYYEWKQGIVSSKHVKLEDVLYQWTDREAMQFESVYGNKKEEEEKRKFHKYTDYDDISFDVTVKTPYEGSWFSEEAHRNLTVLKKEYRSLVKQYHPDNASEEGNSAIFQKIMSERAEIIAALK